MSDTDITTWIRSTMLPDVASLALVLTPGSRWHVAAENLIGKESKLADLRDMIRTWDSQRWLVDQFDTQTVSGTPAFTGAYADALSHLGDIERTLDRKIKEFGR